MTTLSEQDYQKVLTFLQELYTYLSFGDFATFVGESVPRLISAEISVFATIDFGEQQVFTSGDAPTIPDMEETFRRCFHEHPFVIHQLKTFDFSAYKLSDFWTEKQLHQSEAVYYRFMRYLDAEDVLSLSFLRSDGINAQQGTLNQDAFTVDSVSLFRGERSFTERDRSILNLLQPHLIQARQTAQAFSQLQQENQQLHGSLNAAGSIVISKEGHIQLMTRKAEQWLRQYFPVKHWGQSLPEHLQRWVSYQQSLFSRNGTPAKTRLPLKVEQDGRQLTARFVADPTQDQYLLLLEEQQQPKLSLEDFELLGLSKREAEVLYWVAKGKENPEIAELLYVGITTVRKHLEHIYQKLGVKTRASAVVEALKCLGMLYCE